MILFPSSRARDGLVNGMDRSADATRFAGSLMKCLAAAAGLVDDVGGGGRDRVKEEGFTGHSSGEGD